MRAESGTRDNPESKSDELAIVGYSLTQEGEEIPARRREYLPMSLGGEPEQLWEESHSARDLKTKRMEREWSDELFGPASRSATRQYTHRER
jgi:hypothetical protein